MRQYEVERRVPGHFPVPENFTLDCEADVRDSYFLVSEEGLGRIRRIIIYPTLQEIFAYGIKRRSGNALAEQERALSKDGYEELCRQAGELNPVIVSGHRKQYRNNGTAICVDDIDQLGPWTEVEVLVRRKVDVPLALQTVNRIMRELGVSDTDIMDETYPEMLYCHH